MVALPILILIIAMIVLGLIQKRPARTQWLALLAFALLAWLSSLVLLNQTNLFLSPPGQAAGEKLLPRVGLSAGRADWELAWIVLSLLIAIVLTTPARHQVPTWDQWLRLVAIFTLWLGSLLAANAFTALLFWVLIEYLMHTISARRSEHESASTFRWRISWFLLGTLMVVAGMLEGSPASSALNLGRQLLIAALLILAAVPHPGLTQRSLPNIDADLAWLFRLMPAIFGLSIFNRIYLWDATVGNGWTLALSAIALVYAIYRWFATKHDIAAIQWLALILMAANFGLSSAVGGTHMEAGLLTGAAVLVLVAGLFGLLQPFDRKYAFFLFLSGLILCGLPGVIGQAWLETWLQGSGGWLAKGLAGLGILALLIRFARNLQLGSVPWGSGEALARWTYWAGVVTPLLAGVSAWMVRWRTFSIESLTAFLVLVIAGIGAYWLLQVSSIEVKAIRQVGSRGLVAGLKGAAQASLNWLASVVRWTGQIFEGEAGMLWVLVVLQAVLLALLQEGL